MSEAKLSKKQPFKDKDTPSGIPVKRSQITKITKSHRLGIKETPEMMLLDANSNGEQEPGKVHGNGSKTGSSALSMAYRCKLCFKRF